MRKVLAIGVLIFIGFILNTVALFTTGWVAMNLYVKTYYIGIMPFQGGWQPSWFVTASWLMFISFFISLVLLAAYSDAMRRIRHCGCSHSIRHSFNGISLIATVVAVFEIVAFILTASNLNDRSFFYTTQVSLGYSSFLALASGIVYLVAAGMSQHVRHYDCC